MQRAVELSLICLAAALAGCGGGGGSPGQGSGGNAQAGAATQDTAAPAARQATPAATDSAGVPAAMEQAEGLAEDAQDDIPAGRWSAAGSKVSQLQGLRSQLTSAGAATGDVDAFASAVDSLASAIGRRARFPALTAANRVSRLLNGMMASYPTKVPIAVAYMDVAGRDVLYHAQQGQWTAANDAVSEVRHNYTSVADHVKAADAQLDSTVIGELDRMQRAIASKDASTATSLANRLLEDVDRIEKTY